MGRSQRREYCANLLLTPFCFRPSWSIAATVFHAIAVSVNGNDLGVMQQSVEQGRGKHLVSQQLSPGGKAGIGGEQDGTVLITSSD
jgi:hypothetical protein